jgi:hypothetical protein
MKRQLPQRLSLVVKCSLISVGVLAFAALIFLITRPDAKPYLPGEGVEGITRSLDRSTPSDHPRIQFVDSAREAGVNFLHFQGTRSTQLPEDMGSGAAWGDYDRDGDLDLYACAISGPLNEDPRTLGHSPIHNSLFQNQGDGHFVEKALETGVGLHAISMAAAWGDFDNDRNLDLAVTTFGTVYMFKNCGNGTFIDVSNKLGTDRFEGFWTGVAWADYDRDRDLDLYVCGYVQYQYDPADLDKSTFQYKAAVPFTLNPSSYPPSSNLLFRNEGDSFKEVAKTAGVDNPSGRSLSAAWCDFDGDGWPDLYVANDVSDNVMYRNLGDGTFEEVSHKAWVADYRGAMGLALGDWDNDLDIDIFITHWLAQENALYDNTRRFLGESNGEPTMLFYDVADQTGLGQIALQYIGWGCSFLDYDNDGRQDLLVVNGSTFQEETDPSKLVPMRNLLFWNRGPEDGFFELGELTGTGFSKARVGRGAALADYDDDGDVDAFILVHGGPALLLRNDGGNRQNWLKVRVAGKGHNYSGVGARLELRTAEITQCQVIGSQPSYMSQNALEAHFGLGALERIDKLTVFFPCGQVEELTDIPANQTILVQEGAT